MHYVWARGLCGLSGGEGDDDGWGKGEEKVKRGGELEGSEEKEARLNCFGGCRK